MLNKVLLYEKQFYFYYFSESNNKILLCTLSKNWIANQPDILLVDKLMPTTCTHLLYKIQTDSENIGKLYKFIFLLFDFIFIYVVFNLR